MIERHAVVSLRLRATQRLVDAEVMELGEATRLRLLGGARVKAQHLSMGVDVELVDFGERYATEDVSVIAFDSDRSELELSGTVELKHVRRRATFRERAELDLRVAPYRGGPVTPTGGLGPTAVMGQCIDIGGGGLCIETKNSIGALAGDNVWVELDIQGTMVNAIARIAWLHERESGRTKAGLAFIEVDQRGHDRLYRFLYDLQRSRRR